MNIPRKHHNPRYWILLHRLGFFFFFFFLFCFLTIVPRHEKTCFAICEQQRRRSACVSAVVRCLDSIILLVSIHEISSLNLDSVAAQAGLSLPWSETTNSNLFLIIPTLS